MNVDKRCLGNLSPAHKYVRHLFIDSEIQLRFLREMSQQGAALQSYNNELIKCELRGHGLWVDYTQPRSCVDRAWDLLVG